MRRNTPRDHYVYAHLDNPENFPIYIGRGRGRRAYSDDRNEYWTQYISKYSRGFQTTILAKELTEEEALAIENYFITCIGRALEGSGPLLNITDGGLNEGVYVSIPFGLPHIDVQSKLTETGKNLLRNTPRHGLPDKISSYLFDIISDTISAKRSYFINDLVKTRNPRMPWVVPFCLAVQPKKNEAYELHCEPIDSIIARMNAPLKLDNLPRRTKYDSIIGQISNHFELILQDSVSLFVDEIKITTVDPQWFFNAEFIHDYAKTIHCANKGILLSARYIGSNNRFRKELNIHDFEIATTKPAIKTT